MISSSFMHSRFALLCQGLVISTLAACGGSGSGSGTGPDAGAIEEPGGPRFLSFGANTMTLRDGADTLTISAVLTDEDGVDDIIGGQLFDDETGAALNAFATAAQEGAYATTITWRQLTQARPDVPTAYGADLSIRLRATFFDTAGHEASRTTTVAMTCTAAGIVGRVGLTNCEVGARCEDARASAFNCELVSSGATGTEACQGWAGTSCSSCIKRADSSPVGCAEIANDFEGNLCRCN